MSSPDGERCKERFMDILMPQLGETVEEGRVSSWLKKEGDSVSKGDVLFEVETDKVTTEIPATSEGKLSEIRVQEGDTVPVGTVVAVITGGTEVPNAAEISNPNSVFSSNSDGQSKEGLHTLALGKVRAVGRDHGGKRLSPLARRLIAEHQLDVNAINGTGAAGRVTKRDVYAALAQKNGGANSSSQVTESGATSLRPIAPKPSITSSSGDVSVLPFSGIRKATAEHMVRSKATSPHVFQAVEVDYSKIETLRSQIKRAWKDKHGFSLTYLPFIAHATCMALQEFSYINAYVEGDSLLVHKRVHLGIAVDLNFEGLVVPVVRDAHLMNLTGIASEISRLAGQARNRKLLNDELSGATYTLSNSGSFGTVFTAPIISQPQVAIMSIDGVHKKPVVIEDELGDSLAIRPCGMLAQSFDHRAIDGAYSAAFLKRMKEILEHHNWDVTV